MKKLLVFLIFISQISYSAPNERYFHLYGGVGEIFGLSSIRFGRSNWEAGLLNRRSLGLTFIEHKENKYFSAGPMLNLNGSPGAFVSLGMEWLFFGFTSLRIEANTGHAIDNYSSSEVNIGASIYW